MGQISSELSQNPNGHFRFQNFIKNFLVSFKQEKEEEDRLKLVIEGKSIFDVHNSFWLMK